MEEFYLQQLSVMLKAICHTDDVSRKASQEHWDNIAKPIGSLGKFEEITEQIAAIQHTADINIDKKALIIFCADNGVVSEGVSQTGQDVTAVVTNNFAKGITSANIMAGMADVDVLPVDIGVSGEITQPGVMDLKISPGTKDIAKEAAMTKEQALEAILTGIRLAGQAKDMGYQLIAAGEMGIGNTTTSAAIASVMMNLYPSDVTGHGAGLSDEGLERKTEVIKQAIALHHPDVSDPLNVLACLGGYDIGGICGLFLGGAIYGLPVVMDGLVSAAAALLAVKFNPLVKEYLIASHTGKEPACSYAMQYMGFEPVIHAGMALGEGTGAILMMALLDMVCAVYRKNSTFDDIDITPYKRFEG